MNMMSIVNGVKLREFLIIYAAYSVSYLLGIIRMCRTISGLEPFDAHRTAFSTVWEGDMITHISSPNVVGLSCNEPGDPKSVDAAVLISG